MWVCICRWAWEGKIKVKRFLRRDRSELFRFSPQAQTWRPCEDIVAVAGCEQYQEPVVEAEGVRLPSVLWENEQLWFEPLSLWLCTMSGWANKYWPLRITRASSGHCLVQKPCLPSRKRGHGSPWVNHSNLRVSGRDPARGSHSGSCEDSFGSMKAAVRVLCPHGAMLSKVYP